MSAAPFLYVSGNKCTSCLHYLAFNPNAQGGVHYLGTIEARAPARLPYLVGCSEPQNQCATQSRAWGRSIPPPTIQSNIISFVSSTSSLHRRFAVFLPQMLFNLRGIHPPKLRMQRSPGSNPFSRRGPSQRQSREHQEPVMLLLLIFVDPLNDFV